MMTRLLPILFVGLLLYLFTPNLKAQCADSTKTAPFISMGTTTGQGDDCDIFGADTEDVIYEVIIPVAAVWTFDLCGASYDTKLEVGTTCCSSDIGFNDDFCGAGSSISSVLSPGTYYVTVDGFSTNTGNYTLEVSAIPFAIDFTEVAPFNTTGNTCNAGNDCPIYISEEIIYQVSIPTNGLWTFSLCGSSYDTKLAVGSSYCSTDVGTNDDFCGLQSQVSAIIPSGTYFVAVEGAGTDCGNYTLDVSVDNPPTITCLSDRTIILGDTIPNFIDSVTIADSEDLNPTVTQSPLSGTVVLCDTIPVTLTVMDNNGQTATCSFSIFPNDTIKPLVMDCPTDTIMIAASDSCGATIFYDMPRGTDNCETVPSITSSDTLTTSFAGGNGFHGNMFDVVVTNTLHITSFDVNLDEIVGTTHNVEIYYKLGTYVGSETNSADWTLLGSATAISAGQDNPTPVAIGGLTLNAGQTYALYVTATGGSQIDYTNGGTVGDVWASNSDLQILEGAGKSYPFDQTFTTRNWNGSIYYEIVHQASTIITPVQTAGLGSGAFFPVGTTTETYVFTDHQGNSDSCTFTITVQDTTKPIVAAQDITVYLNADGEVMPNAADANTGSTDSCGIQSMEIVPDIFDCSHRGTQAALFVVTDNSGNTASTSIMVTVMDTITPVAAGQDITVYLDATGQVMVNPSDVENGSTENCDVESMTLSQTNFNCSNIGTNAVLYTVTDSSGNSSDINITITVADTIAPVVLTQDFTVNLDSMGQATITTSNINNGSSDNCGIQSMSLDQTMFDCNHVGTPNMVTLTITDVNGNTSSGTALVTVEETIFPIAVAQDISVSLDSMGQATIAASDINNGSSDNCGIQSMSLSKTMFNCSDVGIDTVVLTITDLSGNVSTDTATVTITDTISPIIITQNITVNLDSMGQAAITVGSINNGSWDNCGIQSMSINQAAFDCTDIGGNIVNLTITDSTGNTSTGSATVIIEDDIAPIVVTQNITISLGANGQAIITAGDINNGSSDNCGIQSMSLSKTVFDCNDVGAVNMIVLSVTDVNGNTSAGSANVTVEETMLPIVLTQNQTIVLDANGQASITTADIDNGSSDNCGIQSMSLNQMDFDCSDVGANTVTLTVTDVNGNFNSATATVIVQDNTPITAIAQDLTITLDGSGQAFITASDIDNGSSDNCSITLAIDQTDFDCSDVGDNLITLTVTNSHGQVATAPAIVTVIDDEQPSISCNNLIIELDAFNTYTLTEQEIISSMSDNCGISDVAISQTQFNYNHIGFQELQIQVTDDNGNTTVCTPLLEIRGFCLDVPQVFSPNGDNINDTWILSCIHQYEHRVIIVNRWGQIMMDSQAYRSWDGRGLNGEEAQDGAYNYIITLKDDQGREYKTTGAVNLVR